MSRDDFFTGLIPGLFSGNLGLRSRGRMASPSMILFRQTQAVTALIPTSLARQASG